MTAELRITTASASYPIRVGSGIIDEIGGLLQGLGISTDAKVMILTDDVVSQFGYPKQVQSRLEACGFTTRVESVPPRDASKSLETAERLYNAMLDFGVRRSGVVIAVGGGVVGDLGGFIAATYLRGVHFIQMPTTLLAHDSSIGGKVGINLSRGKNLVGAFYHPRAVWMDVNFLETLPTREWRGGMAEVIKHGLIGDVGLFQQLEDSPVPEYPGATRSESLIARAIAVKVAIVQQDERETELRMALNLGHTVGHAVEQVSHYQLNHGEAISIGLAVETEIAFGRGWVTEKERDRILRALSNHGLPIHSPEYAFDAIVETLNYDKKHSSAGWTFVLPKSIGEVCITRDVTMLELRNAWEKAQKGTGK